MSNLETDHDPPSLPSIETKMAEAQRLCHMIKRSDFDGYGFNLHSEKGKPGQYIGKVDEKSPAEESGLHQGDRIIEVNGVNIGSETHKQVVQRIKAIENEVRLLVIDPDVENQLKQQLAGSNKQQQQQQQQQAAGTVVEQQKQKQINNNNNSNGSQTSSPSSSLKQLNNNGNNNKMSLSTSSSLSVDSTNGNDTETASAAITPTPSQKTIEANAPNTIAAAAAAAATTIQNGGSSSNGTTTTAKKLSTGPSSTGLNLKMTAAEMRAKLQSKKKYDPKNDTVDLRKKFDIIQKL